MAGRGWEQGREAGAAPWRTHIGVAGPVPPSLAQTVLAPNGWPGRSRGQRREMRPRVMDAVGGLTVGRGSRGLTWGCRSADWRTTHHHHTTCCSRPTESMGPRPHPHPLVETQRGHTRVCSTTGWKGKGGGKGVSVTLQSSEFNASSLSTIPQITGTVLSGIGGVGHTGSQLESRGLGRNSTRAY